MNDILKPQVLVVGGGPGGYVAAIRCGQLGLDTVLVESDRLGGTCLIRGCIPSKALIHMAHRFSEMVEAATGEGTKDGVSLTAKPSLDFTQTMGWKDNIISNLDKGVGSLLKKAKITTVLGWATFSDGKTCEVQTSDGVIIIKPTNIILATGSTPIELPKLPFGGDVISSTEALSLTEIPSDLVVIGGGYIGLELGSAYSKLGSNVSIVEASDNILPQYDDRLVSPLKDAIEREGITLHLGAQATIFKNGTLFVEQKDGTVTKISATKVLVTVGRQPLTQGWGLENMPIKMAGSFIDVNEQCLTSCTNVWAIGDIVGEPMLAHKASAQGEMVAEIIAGKKRRFDPIAIPSICYTSPEIVSVGLHPNESANEPHTITGVFPLAANGRSLIQSGVNCKGFVRVVALKSNHRIVGVQAVGHGISELSTAFTHAVETGTILEDIAGIIHAHPSIGESFHEASLSALGRAIHAH